MNFYKRIFFYSFLFFVSVFFNSCGIYSFRDVSIPPEVKTVKLNYIENKASYVNPLLAPQLNDAFAKMIISQTKLRRVDADDANYVVTATITDYSVSTSGVSSTSQASQDRLTVGVHIILRENYGSGEKAVDDTKEYDVTGNYDFAASQSLQAAETSLMSQMVKDLSESMFSKIFSNW